MQIGYFQFDNLVKNKVPFTLVNFDVQTQEIYTGHHGTHIERCLLNLKHPYYGKNIFSKWQYTLLNGKTQILNDFKSKEFPPQQALVVLCPDGKLAKQIHQEIEKLGYINAFWVEGGWQKIKTDFEKDK